MLIESRGIESEDTDSGGAFLNYRANTDIGLYLFHERISFVVLWYCGRYHNTICVKVSKVLNREILDSTFFYE